ncbi:hypothetical protein MMC13_002247 [Lambiella insularis]|nr:hypothetical protein [Lambiella insularis]
MECEVESVDISQLKVLALGLKPESQVPGASARTASHEKRRSRGTKHHHAQPQRAKPREQEPSSGVPSPPSSRRPASVPAVRLSAPQPELPSTIPESLRPGKMSLGSGKSGDTQPLSQSYYDGLDAACIVPVGSNASALQRASGVPFTASQGQTGHVDLVGLFEQPSGSLEGGMTEQNEDDDYAITQVDIHTELYPEAKRFQEPRTPATTGKKRDYNGEVLSEGVETPSLPVNPFANHSTADVGIMGLSQVFKTTQAPSSPFLNPLPSDFTSDRPSPGVYSVQRPSTGLPLSSPAKLQQKPLPRSVTEPHDNYISMKASQAERERKIRMQAISSPVNARKHLQDSFDDGFESEESQLRRRLNRKRIDSEVNQQFENIKAKMRPNSRIHSRGSGKRNTVRQGPFSSPEVPRAVRSTVVVSDDPQPEGVDGNDSEDETEHEEDTDNQEIELPDELGEDDKENAEARRVQVPMTTSRTPRKSYITITSQSSPLKRRLRSSPVHDEIDELATEARPCGALFLADPTTPALPDQHIAIADSQPSPHTNRLKQSKTTNAGLLTGAITSSEPAAFIPQSQINSPPHSSQINSSVIRHYENGSSVPQQPALLSSQTSGSPKVLETSSPLQQISPRRSLIGSGALLSQEKRHSTTLLARSPPRLPVTEPKTRTASEVDSASPVHLEALTSKDKHKVYEAGEIHVTPRGFEAGAVPTAQFNMQSCAESNQTPRQIANNSRSTIPETSSVLRHTTAAIPTPTSPKVSEPTTSVPANAQIVRLDADQRQQPSDTSTFFATANTQQTSTGSANMMMRRSSESSTSPRNVRTSMLKTFAAIATDPSPPDGIDFEDADISIMTTDDKEFQAIMDSSSPIGPRRKRRRMLDDPVIRVIDGNLLKVAPTQSSSALGSSLSGADSLTSPSERAVMSTPPTELREATRVAGVSPLDASFVAWPSGMSKGLAKNNRATRRPAVIVPPRKRKSRSAHDEFERATRNVEAQSEAADVPTIRPASEAVVAANRVLAAFNGSPPGHYPATCIGVVAGENPKYKVCFDDGTIDIIHGPGVKRFELREGDAIKLDIPGARKRSYVVVALLRKQELGPPPVPSSSTGSRKTRSHNVPSLTTTDIYGHENVLVRLKQDVCDSGELIFPISKVYLDSIQWRSLKDRFYSFSAPTHEPISGLSTPSEPPSTPSTSSSRTRRMNAFARSYSMNSVPTSAVRKTSDLFDNVVFGITNISEDASRRQTETYIKSNGGYLINDGFDELFHVPEMTPISPARHIDRPARFGLMPAHQHHGFACLIADKHCRSRKFFQALALGIPCLATRWVRDCVSKQRLLPWEPYLLPSGESTFLNTIRTRLLPAYSTESAQLSEIIANRPNFLSGTSVLLITGKGKDEQMMKAYPFIAYALGASNVSRAANLDAARQMVQEAQGNGKPWDWVCYPEGEKGGDAFGGKYARSVLFGSNERGRKRKRSGMCESVRKPRVVVTEFVMQSLILGQLLDDE